MRKNDLNRFPFRECLDFTKAEANAPPFRSLSVLWLVPRNVSKRFRRF